MTALVVIRHAPTAWNRAGRLQGRSDQPAEPQGLDALRRWHLPAAWRRYRWVTSPLLRARQTATALGHPEAEPVEALAEMAWGSWEGRRLADLRDELGAEMVRHEARGLDLQPPGGESPRQVQARLAPWLAATALAGRPTVAVCHKGVIRALYALAAGWDMRGPPPERLALDRAQGFRLDPAGRPALVRANIVLGP